MRTDLLLELADFLEKLDPNRFDIRTWRRPTKDSVLCISSNKALNIYYLFVERICIEYSHS